MSLHRNVDTLTRGLVHTPLAVMWGMDMPLSLMVLTKAEESRWRCRPSDWSRIMSVQTGCVEDTREEGEQVMKPLVMWVVVVTNPSFSGCLPCR